MTSDHALVRPAFSPSTSTAGAAERLHLGTAVDEVLALLPYGHVVLTAFRIDVSRGARTLAEAAYAADLEPVVLLDALQSTVCVSFDAGATAEVQPAPTTARPGAW